MTTSSDQSLAGYQRGRGPAYTAMMLRDDAEVVIEFAKRARFWNARFGHPECFFILPAKNPSALGNLFDREDTYPAMI